MFCYDCVKRYIESQLSEGDGTYKCMNCPSQLTIDYILDEDILDKIKIQQEIRYVNAFAQICDDFQICPFCRRFGCIISDDHPTPWIECDKCSERWCKKCREHGHLGSCDRIQNPTSENIRNRIAETINNATMHKLKVRKKLMIKEK